MLGSLLALLVVCLAGWALDVPARLEGLTLPGGSYSSATVKEGQDWPAMVGDRLVSEKPEKVVSLSPMITEALLSLPGHEALCAVTEYCDARSTGLATVGTPLLPRTEDIIALAPDYVLCQTPLAGPVQTELEEAGVEVIQMSWRKRGWRSSRWTPRRTLPPCGNSTASWGRCWGATRPAAPWAMA